MNKIISTFLLSGFLVGLITFAQSADQTVELTGNDLMQFNSKAFTVTAGSKVTLVFKHIGMLPKVAMGHNVVILKPGVDVVKFAQDAITAAATGYIPAARKGDIIVHTEMIGGGEETTITFTAPAAGEYVYICTFPGHYALMRGIMTVK